MSSGGARLLDVESGRQQETKIEKRELTSKDVRTASGGANKPLRSN
jgi:hypothetical protein